MLEGPSRTLAAGTVKVKGESGEGSVAMGSGEREQDRGNVFRMVGWARPSGEYGERLKHQRSSDIPTPAYIQSATDLGVQAVQTPMQAFFSGRQSYHGGSQNDTLCFETWRQNRPPYSTVIQTSTLPRLCLALL